MNTATHPISGNTLVVGASGFVGRSLVARLIQDGVHVFAHSRIQGREVAGASMRYGDLSDPAVCVSALKDMETVFYVAGAKQNIFQHTERPFDFVYQNVQPFLIFMEAMRHSGVKKCIYLSSTHALAEWQSGADGYAVGKYINERIVNAYTPQTRIPVSVIRSCAVYGPGDNFDEATANFIPALIRRIDTSEGDFTVWGSGERQMQYMYVDDLVANLIGAAQEDSSVHTVGNAEVWSVNAIVEKIMKILKKESVILHDTTKPDKPTQLFTFDNLVEPKVSLQEGLEKVVEYYKANVSHTVPQ